MDIVIMFSKEWQMTPFEVLQQDIDNFILMTNYLTRLGENKEEKSTTSKKDDGFWDM